jgi:signal peptidase II
MGQSVNIISGLMNLTYYNNTGAAFGMLGNSRIMLIFVAFILLFYLISELKKNINNKATLLFLTFIISGLVGNLIDRIFRGYVVDFIDLSIFNPIFNVSDIFISIGCVFTIIMLIKEEVNEHKSKK